MRVKPELLEQELNRRLAPVYVIGGDEPQLVQEACDQVRARARQQGFVDRQVYTVDRGFDWGLLQSLTETLSLFGDQRLLELRLPGSKPGDKGAKALRQYAERVPEDTVLMLICGKLDASTMKSVWLNTLDKEGVVVQVWPIARAQLPEWIRQRMQQKGLQPTREAAALLADRVEGNLLAAVQEIEKLALLQAGGRIDVEAVGQAVADSARFDIYGLVDSALGGRPERTARILTGLRAEGIDPVLISWAFGREIRSLNAMSHAVGQGQAVERVLNGFRVWERRKPLLRQALKRHSPKDWMKLLLHCALIDRIIKGVSLGNPWDELLQLGFELAGKPPFQVK